jgi:hypothetical protein
MPDAALHDTLIETLACELRPVRRLPPPWLRAAIWLAAVAALGVVLAQLGDLSAMWRRLMATPDMWLSALGAALTVPLAAVAAFQTSMPCRSPRWALLPLPTTAIWLAFSGMGCVRLLPISGVPRAHFIDERGCLLFIIGISVPLSLLLVTMLRRACPLRPNLTAGLAGLAAAAAAATLLVPFHPYDAAVSDLVVHVFAVLLVVFVNRTLAGRLLSAAGAAAPVWRTAQHRIS